MCFSASCPLFVSLAEEGWLSKKITSDIARVYLTPIKEKNIDCLILGCTHYPLLKNVIRKVMGKKVTLIDSAKETAKVVKFVLAQTNSLSQRKKAGSRKFFVSDEPEAFRRVGEHFLSKRIDNIKKVKDNV